MSRSEDSSDSATAGTSSSTSYAFLNNDRYVPHRDESDDNLSDLDDEIKQYIATDKEVNDKITQIVGHSLY